MTRWTLAASLGLHAAALGAALAFLHPGAAPATERAPTRLQVVAPHGAVDLSEAAEPLEPRAAPEPERVPAPDLPEITLEPEAPTPEAQEALEAPTPDEGPQPLLGLAGRRLKPVAGVPPPSPAAPRAPAPTAPPAPTASVAAAPAPLVPLVRPDPPYPAGLAWRGEVTLSLLLLVQPDGTVGDVVVESASGLPALDAHVSAFLARTWRFAPIAAPRWVRQGFRIHPSS